MTRGASQNHISTTTLWVILYLGGPLFPFAVKVFIRFISSIPNVKSSIFDASDLSLITVLIWLFVRQNLVEKEIRLRNEDKINDVNFWAAICFGAASLFFVLYILAEVFTTQAIDLEEINKAQSLIWIRNSVFLCFLISLPIIVRIQSSFDLRARIK